MFARSGLVGINQLCSLKLPQSPCSQGNGGGKGKNSLRVCGHKKLRCWRNDRNSPSEAKADANSGFVQSRRPRPVCISPIVSADPAVNVNAAAVRRCINATAAPSKLQPPSRLQSQPHRTQHSRGHISPKRRAMVTPSCEGRRCSCGGIRVKLADPQPGICSLNRGFHRRSCRRSLSPGISAPRCSHALTAALQLADIGEA